MPKPRLAAFTLAESSVFAGACCAMPHTTLNKKNRTRITYLMSLCKEILFSKRKYPFFGQKAFLLPGQVDSTVDIQPAAAPVEGHVALHRHDGIVDPLALVDIV